jgi:hypothetical protein
MTSWRLIVVFSLLIMHLVATSAKSADIRYIGKTAVISFPDNRQLEAIELTGEIQQGDAAKLAKEVLRLDDRFNVGKQIYVVFLRSRGGNFEEGLRLLRLFRERGLITAIRAGAECLSACAVAFMGGRYINWDSGVPPESFRVIEPGARLGFHRPWLNLPPAPDATVASELFYKKVAEAYSEASRQVGLLIQELRTNQTSSSIVAEMLKETRDYFEIDTVDKAGRWNIRVVGSTHVHSFDIDRELAARACTNVNRWRNDYYAGVNPDIQFQDFLPSDFTNAENARGQSRIELAELFGPESFEYIFAIPYEGQGCGFRSDKIGTLQRKKSYVKFHDGTASLGVWPVESISFFSPDMKLEDLR